jgi:hypothetical protein
MHAHWQWQHPVAVCWCTSHALLLAVHTVAAAAAVPTGSGCSRVSLICSPTVAVQTTPAAFASLSAHTADYSASLMRLLVVQHQMRHQD